MTTSLNKADATSNGSAMMIPRVVIAALLLISFSACKHNPVDVSIKNPRDFTWSIDTVGGEMVTMWGNSNRDLYMVGFNNLILHYDGQAWHSEWLSVGPGLPIRKGGDYFGVYGFGPGDVFAVGGTSWGYGLDSSLVVHYDGTRWAEQLVEGGRNIETVWGSASKDVWIGGHAGTLFHYNGATWGRTPIDANLDVNDIRGFGANDIYFLGTRYNSNDFNFNYRVIGHYDGSSWSLIDSMSVGGSKFGDAKLGIIGSTLYSVGYSGIYSFRNGQWKLELMTTRGLSGIYASGPNNAYAVGIDMFHFDGVAWSQITNMHFEGYGMGSVWCNESEAFTFSVLYLIGTAVVHGR